MTIGLTLFGLVMVLSASSVSSLYQLDASPLYQFKKQLIYAAAGTAGFLFARSMDYRVLGRMAGPMTVIAIATMVAVLIPGIGQEVNGSRRWLNIGIGQFQPSEFAKLALVVFVADLLSRRVNRMERPELTVRPVMFLLGIFSVLLLLQPKLGTPIVLAAIAMIMLFIAGAKAGSLATWTAVGVCLSGFFAMSEGYRRARIFAFLDPWQYPTTIGLQTIQSQVGIASGGLLGVGLGASRAKWGFLPEAQSDFIFAIVAEEVGLVGAAALIGGFVLLGVFGVKTALHAPDRFGMLLATGLTTWLILQAFLNIGMTLGRLPITGEPLPFVSAGGSSLIMSLFAAGLLANVARRAQL